MIQTGITFGNKLRELRIEQNISQVQLAEILDTTSQAVSQWELGKRMPNVKIIILLAGHFNVTTDYLLGVSSEREDTLPLGFELEMLVQACRKLPAEEINKLTRVAEIIT